MNVNEIMRIVAPLLRGITFDGEKGLFVRYVGDLHIHKDLKTLHPDIPGIKKGGVTAEKLLSFLQVEIDRFRAGNDAAPDCVVLSGCGTFIFGNTYQDTENKLSGSTVRHIPPSGGGTSINTIKNKICLVTGGAQGIGEGITRELIDKGAFVFIADINDKQLNNLCEGINKKYNRIVCLPVRGDISNPEQVKEMFHEIVRLAGGLDVLISNAGILKAGSVQEMDPDDFRKVTEVNYTGFFLCAQQAAKIMSFQNLAGNNYYSDIIQINSKSGLAGSSRNAAYAGSKFGGIGLTQSFALELVKDNIKVNAICPGNFLDGPLWCDPEKGLFVQYLHAGKVPGAKTTEDVKRYYESRVPMKRGCTVADLMKAMYYIIDQKYETGQAIPVTGGQVMLR